MADHKSNEIPEMSSAGSNSNPSMEQKPIDPKELEKAKKEMEKTKEKLEKLKGAIVKKFPFTVAIGILPPQSIPRFIEEEELEKQFGKDLEKNIHLIIIIPEEKFKDIKKIKEEIINEVKKEGEKIWVHVKTPVDVFEYGLNSKFDLTSAIALAYPLLDKGFLGSLRVAEIHKSLILRKFEKYVTSYVIAGSFVRGTATKTSDMDAYVIIDDTDVKRMPRLELKERLRSMIYQYIGEASELAGVKNVLNVQVYLLTDFWESVKDAHPVMFTFIRDGIPLHDRGTFMPWKALLRMGKIKPSPEAIESFMSMGDKVVQRAKKALLDIVTMDLYWAVLTPSQALVMLYGLPPPTPKETVAKMREIFVDKEKILEKKYIDILERIVGIYKDFEHEKVKDIKGVEIDKLVEDTEAYNKRLKELKDQIEKRTQEKTIEQISEDILNLLKNILGNKPQAALVAEFDKEIIKKGKLPPQSLKILKDALAAKDSLKEKGKKEKTDKNKVEDLRKNAAVLINELIEYTQRKEIAQMNKGRIEIKFKDKGKDMHATLILGNGNAFLIKEGLIYKISNSSMQITTQQEFEKSVLETKDKKLETSGKTFDVLRKELGDFEVVL